jgi:hypothetical protein
MISPAVVAGIFSFELHPVHDYIPHSVPIISAWYGEYKRTHSHNGEMNTIRILLRGQTNSIVQTNNPNKTKKKRGKTPKHTTTN